MAKDFHQLQWDAALEDDCRQIIRLAVREDLDRWHDWTTLALVAADQQGDAAFVTREPGVIAGLRAAETTLDEMQANVRWKNLVNDGDLVDAGEMIAHMNGLARDMLTCERLLLNLVGRLSGIATLTNKFTRQVKDTRVPVYDTRKTVPGWRRLEKYAVRCGGGRNHRTGLYDAILIKDNHLAIARSQNLDPAEAVQQTREFLARVDSSLPTNDLILEIEVDSLDQLAKALPAHPDIVLLDNMSCNLLREAVQLRDRVAPEVQLEASGGVDLQSVAQIAATGIDRISTGQLTHSACTLDIGLDWHSNP